MIRRGFTLVELLVALALSALLMGAALSSAAFVGRRHTELQEIARLHERGAYALGLLEPEVQLAGFGGLAPMTAWRWPASLPTGAIACGTLTAASPSALRLDVAYVLSCAAQGGGAAADSDVLTVLRAGTRLAAPTSGRLQVVTSRRAGAPPEVRLDGVWPSTVSPIENLDELHDLELQSFYVSKDSDGQPGLPALRVKSLAAVDGRVTFIDRELVPGVEQICIEVASGEGDALTFTHGSAAFAATRLPAAIRIKLSLRGERAWSAAQEQSFDCGARHTSHRDAIVRLAAVRTWAPRNRYPVGLVR